MNEIWKDIPSYEGLYQVSNLGNVKSLNRFVTRGGNSVFRTGNILKATFTKDYFKVVLSKDANKKTFTVHQLVAISFLNHKIDGHKLVIDHINNNPLDNRLENLQIVTQRFNAFKKRDNYSSKYKGVSWCKAKNKWVSRITINNKRYSLGVFNCELAAHLSYQNKLKTL
jgi:hypothetical protein